MVGDVALVDSSPLTTVSQNCSRKIYDRFPSEGHVPRSWLRPAGNSNFPTLPVAPRELAEISESRFHATDVSETAKKRTMHDESFVSSCAELTRYADDAPDGEESSRSWLSQARQRCTNVCNWLPKMCSCLESGSTLTVPGRNILSRGGRTGGGNRTRVGSYERLGSRSSIFEFTGTIHRARRKTENLVHPSQPIEPEKQTEDIRFYNDDLTWTTLVVEKNLRTLDLCQLLKVKKNVNDIAWSIVETWPELGIERTLEDHEDILGVHREMEMFTSQHDRKFFFRLDFLKYEFFVNPKQFFPADMVAFPSAEDPGTLIDVESALRNYLLREDAGCPQVFSLVWIRAADSDTWRKTHMLLRDRKLYVAKKTIGTPTKRPVDNEQLIPLARLSDYVVYRISNAKRCFNAPFEWAACLRPSSNAEPEGTEAGEPGLKVIAFHSEKSRVCWLTAMRLAKYGKQLRENYRAFKNKQCEQTGGDSPKERYNNYSVSSEYVRSRVAMDFTGSVGRIVEDPKEAKDIAESEGINWRRTWRPFSRPPPGCAVLRLHGLDDGIHVLQPWFHRGLKRENAAAIIRDHGSVDGVFLVRESKSNLGAYVLTYKFSDKVFHAQIQPVFDERCNCWLYTLDKGITKFYDLLQLIEFYQLNAGSLPTRLTHYVQNGVPVTLPRLEGGGASPSPGEAIEKLAAGKIDCANSTNISG